jgi:hypothetical protein
MPENSPWHGASRLGFPGTYIYCICIYTTHKNVGAIKQYATRCSTWRHVDNFNVVANNITTSKQDYQFSEKINIDMERY